MSSNSKKHVLVVPFAGWGHVRSLLHLVLNLVQTHQDLHVTLLLARSVAPRVETEINSATLAIVSDTITSDRLQSIPVSSELEPPDGTFDGSAMAAEAMDYAKCLPNYIQWLFGDQSAPDSCKENRFEGVKPTAVIFDTFQSFVPDMMDALRGPGSIPSIGFCPCNATSAFNHFAPTEQGGLVGQMGQEAEKAIQAGGDVMESFAKFAFSTSDEVVKRPGLPDVYAYEYYPMASVCPLPGPVFAQLINMHKSVLKPSTSGLILPSFADLEPEVVKTLSGILNKPIHMVGMQFPEPIWQGRLLDQVGFKDAEDKRVMRFLDEMKEKYGDNRVVYVSLGSVFWPLLRPELMDFIIDSLIESPLPFLFAHATDLATPNTALLERINSSGKGCAVKFAPQWAVVNHPATGFFLSHCGSNSVAEAVVAKVPLPIIAMPFVADQGEFAMILKSRGCAIDIKQVKSFKPPQFKKLYDGTEIVGTEEAIKSELKDIWKRISGSEGEKMRSNMQELKKICVKSHDSGSAAEGMKNLYQCL